MSTRCIADRVEGIVTICEESALYEQRFRFKPDAVAMVAKSHWGGSRICFCDNTEIQVHASSANVRRAIANAKKG